MGMMSKPGIATQKSRLTFLEAGVEVPVRRSIGSVTIIAPDELDHPIHLVGCRYEVIIQEAELEGELRKALLKLERVYRPRSWRQDPWVWGALGLAIGIALYRAWLRF